MNIMSLRLIALVGSQFACGSMIAALLAIRWAATGRATYGFLPWNVFLAWLSLGLALAWARLDAAAAPRPLRWLTAGAWLAFLPNAPYLVTDLLHFNHDALAPRWFDAMLFGLVALHGLMLGCAGLAVVHPILRDRLGPPRAWLGIAAACLLCGFGIYLGRFVRLNSWDVIADPLLVADTIADRLVRPTAHVRTWFVTAVMGGTQLVAYATLLSLTAPTAVSPTRRRAGAR